MNNRNKYFGFIFLLSIAASSASFAQGPATGTAADAPTPSTVQSTTIFNAPASSPVPEEPYYYITKDVLVVYNYGLTSGKSYPREKHVALRNSIMTVIGKGPHYDSALHQDIYVVQFLKVQKDPHADPTDTIQINQSNMYNRSYCIKASDLTEPIFKKWYRTWQYSLAPNIGTLVVPFKIRPKQGNTPGDFTSDFTLGSSFGVSARISHYQRNYFTIAAVLGLTSVNVDSLTTRGYTLVNSKVPALTPGIGFIFEFNGFQFGGVVGCDYVGGVEGSHWIYNNSLWYSIGIGYQFLRKK